MTPAPPSDAFRYLSYEIDRQRGTLTCRYEVGGEEFTEVFSFPDGDWSAPGVDHAARWLFLLAGVSYYKTHAPKVIDLGDLPMSADGRDLLRRYYVDGLGEFSYRQREYRPDEYPDGLDLTSLTIVGGTELATAEPTAEPATRRPLIPFGGGLDSIVSVDLIRAAGIDDAALFIVNRPDDQFEAIEAPAALTGLPILRATRQIDDKVLRSAQRGYLNGHVPVTGIISAAAVLAARLSGYDAVVMSNEWSASEATLQLADGRALNHQWSKSDAFESSFSAICRRLGLPSYFSLLRSRSELWIAERFAERCRAFLPVFRSCNRSFAIDPAKRLDHWCGVCDKCAFIDLILSPFVAPESLGSVFTGPEPLENPALNDVFRRLLGADADLKPWECVGDVRESRQALRLAAARPDRATSHLQNLLPFVAGFDDGDPTDLLHPLGSDFVPGRYGDAA